MKFTVFGLAKLTPAPLSSDHVPPASGLPVKVANKSTVDPPSLQIEVEPLPPASAACVTFIVRVAILFVQGATPVTV